MVSLVLTRYTGSYKVAHITSFNLRSPPKFTSLFPTSKQQAARWCENEVRSGFLFESYHTKIEITQIPSHVPDPHPTLCPLRSITLTRYSSWHALSSTRNAATIYSVTSIIQTLDHPNTSLLNTSAHFSTI